MNFLLQRCGVRWDRSLLLIALSWQSNKTKSSFQIHSRNSCPGGSQTEVFALGHTTLKRSVSLSRSLSFSLKLLMFACFLNED